MVIQVGDMKYDALGAKIREAFPQTGDITLRNVKGQRFIACGLCGQGRIDIEGVPGNDLGAFLSGPAIRVHGNAQDQAGNTMNAGELVIDGNAGDTTGYSMRGGAIYVRGYAGSRVGIHMKAYKEQQPVLVVGGCVGDFLGEYMAGGALIVLGQNAGRAVTGDHVASGIHGGSIWLRGPVNRAHISAEADVHTPTQEELDLIRPYVQRYCDCFGAKAEDVFSGEWTCVRPQRCNPYGAMYVNNPY